MHTLVQIHWSLFGLVDSTLLSFHSKQTLSDSAFLFTCRCVPSGAHSFYGLVVYGFIQKQLSCPTSVSDFFTFDLIYVIIYIVFIY